MLKKIFFITFCLSIVYSPFTCSQQVAEYNVIEKLSPRDLKTITQEIKNLSPEKKVAFKEYAQHVITITFEPQDIYLFGTIAVCGCCIAKTLIKLCWQNSSKEK